MNTNNRIRTTDLDFESIKQNLKEYLKGQSQFSDYDFEGSGLSILLDVLAYNTHYNALYTNLAINEAFLDSASKRSSVVSKAKELGYVPTSSVAAYATVELTLANDNLSAPSLYELPRYSQFVSNVNGVEYTFYTTESYLAYKNQSQYLYPAVNLREGRLLQTVVTVQSSETPFTVILPNLNIDMSTVRVTVQENAQTTAYKVYTSFKEVSSVLDDTSLVYFYRELDNQQYMIEFGDGKIGKALDAGNVVTVDYIVCNQDNANGARVFTYVGGMPSGSIPYVATIDASYGGSVAESIASIKWNAPRHYTAQNRCVTLDDYKSIIQSNYPNARSVNVWGGEDNYIPSYGDVFISIKPETTEILSDAEKEFILSNVIGPRKIVTVHPKIVDPVYLYVVMQTAFYYDPNLTTRSASDLTALVRQTINDYNNNNLDRFDSVLKYSALSRAIDGADNSIKSSITTIKIHRHIDVIYNKVHTYTVDIGNPIYNSGVPEESVKSTGFYVLNTPQLVYIDDLPTQGSNEGILRLFYYDGPNKIIVKNVGTINYDKGLMLIDDLIITGITTDAFSFILKPQSNDVASVRNQVVSIDPSMVTVTPVIDRPANTYKFTSSRN